MGHLRILLQIAARNLFASRVNVIVGLIMLMGTFFVLVGNALIDSVDQGMTRSIQNSVAGHVQVYSSKSKEELALFGAFGGEANIAPITDFEKMRESLLQVPGVEKVVPMGVRGALITSGNIIDSTLARLRNAYKARDEGTGGPDIAAQVAAQRDHVRQMVRVLKADQERVVAMLDEKSVNPDEKAAVEKAASDAFWQDFDAAPYEKLEFLENKVAPLLADGDLLFLLYVGTDLDTFQQAFDRMKVVKGTPVPKGKRGFLVSKFVMEERFKLKTARRLDKIKESRDTKGFRIDTDAELQRFVKENRTQTRELLLQLDRLKSDTLRTRLQAKLQSQEQDLGKLLATFLDTTDALFDDRYAYFYSDIAPLLQLYRINVGDTLTITAFTSSGYVQSVNVPVYGAVEFDGLEKSFVAGSLNLMDLMTFRDLYGFLTPEKKAELEKLKAASGAKEVAREDAEDELFGGGNTVEAEATPGIVELGEDNGSLAQKLQRDDLVQRVYSQQEIDRGMVLNAAVFLKDPAKAREIIDLINTRSEKEGLGLRAVSWQQASGLIGQLVLFARGVLYLALVIFFVIALVVINNAMMMATLQRVREIGTMRAIGAQRGFVLSMVLVETLALGVVFGAMGAGLGSAVVTWLGHVGIPAKNDQLYFFFSGPRLLPSVSAGNVVAAFLSVLAVSAISTLYPAIVATRVSPVKAMGSEE